MALAGIRVKLECVFGFLSLFDAGEVVDEVEEPDEDSWLYIESVI